MNTLKEISARNIYNHIENISACGPRVDGSPCSIRTVQYIEQYLNDIGLDVDKLPLEFEYVNNATSILLSIGKENSIIPSLPNTRSGLTKEKYIEAEALFVEAGLDEDYEEKNANGKIVFAAEEHYWQGNNMVPTKYFRALRNGAAAFVFSDKRIDDIITCWTMSYGITEIPTVSIPYSHYRALREESLKRKLVCRISVGGEITNTTDYIVSGFLAGKRSNSDIIFVDGSHHETVAYCPGANDNASGSAIMLELARVLKRRGNGNSMIFLSTCAEECLCLGMKKYTEKNKKILEKSVAAFVIDQVAGPHTGIIERGTIYDTKNNYLPTGDFLKSDKWLCDKLTKNAERLGYYLPTYDEPGGSLGEANNFIENKVPAVFICGWNTDTAYHTGHDDMKLISVNSLKAIADVVAYTILKDY
jgi:aminopeptidase YwaD